VTFTAGKRNQFFGLWIRLSWVEDRSPDFIKRLFAGSNSLDLSIRSKGVARPDSTRTRIYNLFGLQDLLAFHQRKRENAPQEVWKARRSRKVFILRFFAEINQSFGYLLISIGSLWIFHALHKRWIVESSLTQGHLHAGGLNPTGQILSGLGERQWFH